MGGLPRHRRIQIQNVRISVGARRHHFDEVVGIPFLCECDDEQCHEFVVVTLPRYDRVRRADCVLVAAGHAVDGGRIYERGDGFELVELPSRSSATG